MADIFYTEYTILCVSRRIYGKHLERSIHECTSWMIETSSDI
jgi:hypothetical protein